MTQRVLGRLAAVLVGAVAAAGLLAGASPASAAPAAAPAAAPPSDASSAAADCVIVLDRAGPDHVSRVVSRACGAAAARSVAPAANTLLMIWYDGYTYSGASTKVYGVSGPCDSSGYGFSNVGAAWNDRIRSWHVYAGCNYSAPFVNANYGGLCHRYHGQVPDGSAMDAQITSIWVSAGSFAWSLCPNP